MSISLARRNANLFVVSMRDRTLTLDGQSRGNRDSFLFGLIEFCVDSATTCFSHDADKLCVPIGLCSLSALLLLLPCFLLVYQRCTFRGGNPRETITFLYSLLGNLCSTTGAILSGQLHIQVLMGAFAAALDAVSFISVLLCWNSNTEKRLRVIRGRRRQHLLAVCVLMVVAGGFLKSRATQLPEDSPVSRRRLLHDTFQENTEILGYILGLLSFIIACTCRFPALCRAYRGQMLTWAHVFSGLLCSLAGALYAAAILLYDTRFGFLLRVMPWLLSAICCVMLDLVILVIHFLKKGTRQQLTTFSLDTQSLLADSGISTEDNAVMKTQKKQQIHSSAQTKTKNVQKMMEMGRYMDVSVQPAGKKVMLCKGEAEERPLNSKVRMIRVNGFCSSDSSCDSSVSSDLEWDFEEENSHWREPTAKQQERDEFPLQVWPKNPKPFNICTCAMFGLPHGERVSSVSFGK